MADSDASNDAQRLLAAMDFASMAAAQEEKHRQETGALLRNLLEVADSLEALEAHCRELAERGGAAQTPVGSVRLILRQLHAVLAKVGVEPINALGRPLDLEHHEVGAVRHDPEREEDTVWEEQTKGYLWKKRLLRRAKVVVASSTAPEPAERVAREEQES